LVKHDLFGKPVSTFPDHALERARHCVALHPRLPLAGAVSSDCLFGFGTAANAGLRRVRHGRDQLRQEIGARTTAHLGEGRYRVGLCDRNQGVVHVERFLCRNETLNRRRSSGRKPRAAANCTEPPRDISKFFTLASYVNAKATIAGICRG
jgi:hypothetical protein